MCGIIGIISDKPVATRLLEGLQRLEYRGYDSSGVATIVKNRFVRQRTVGNLKNLEQILHANPMEGSVGIGHTRWATHGTPNIENAHPHMTSKVALVHNGIIENYMDFKEGLRQKGCHFTSQTDSEVIAHLITELLAAGLPPLAAVEQSIANLKGTFALAIVFADHPDCIIAARQGSPITIGYGQGEMMIASDAIALAPWTQDICYIEEGDTAVITAERVAIFHKGQPVSRPVRTVPLKKHSLSKGIYRHYMLKEIFEQPVALAETLRSLVDEEGQFNLAEVNIPWLSLQRLNLVACGTSYYAAMIAKFWFEKWARLPTEVDIASEFRYRDPLFTPHGLYGFIAQSGETIDTIAALKLVKDNHQPTLALVNTPESSITRIAEQTLYTLAGPEVGVVATKTFTTQLVALASLALMAGQMRQTISREAFAQAISTLWQLPSLVTQVLEQSDMQKIAQSLVHAKDAFYLGRGPFYPLALEGALKFKEITYIHAEGYPAGELKHGPMALIEPNLPVIVLNPLNQWYSKTNSNIAEVLSRRARVICLTDEAGSQDLPPALKETGEVVIMPTLSAPLLAPILYSIPLQLLAYHTALFRGTDVDQPRNLAKSVTVE